MFGSRIGGLLLVGLDVGGVYLELERCFVGEGEKIRGI